MRPTVMRTSSKLFGFGVALVAVLGGGAVLGNAVGPIDVDDEPEHAAEAGGHGADAHGEDSSDDDDDALPAGGLLVSQDGYTLVPDSPVVPAADTDPFGFVVTGPDGHPVERFDVVHDKELHLIVASSDLHQFAHVHPERDDAGHWRVDLPALPPGSYRAFADFRPTDGPELVLGVDVVVPGEVPAPTPLRPSSTATVGDFEVTIDGAVEAGTTSEVTVTVRRDGAGGARETGRVVTTEPYLGAAGHLVALRDGDLAYLHVHPLDDEPDGPVRFGVELPSAGTYALFFDFLVDGTVHTAPFVLEVTR